MCVSVGQAEAAASSRVKHRCRSEVNTCSTLEERRRRRKQRKQSLEAAELGRDREEGEKYIRI